ncbi:MAG TPA: PKD domain-containing protein [Candidatus Hydrogenedentes bacterium]|nr:PKD domain-containing protein [Candidatus Hydrogenedentota bacterium]
MRWHYRIGFIVFFVAGMPGVSGGIMAYDDHVWVRRDSGGVPVNVLANDVIDADTFMESNTSPLHASLQYMGEGSFTIIPEAGYIGPADFSYTLGTPLGEAKLMASDGEASDQFGNSVSLSGDTAVIGVCCEENCRGAAYVFVRSDGIWVEQQKLTASDREDQDHFGTSVSLFGDTVIIGAPDANGSRGASYVFVRAKGSWGEQQKLVASDGEANDYFGISAALSGDTAIVGAAGDNNSTGAVYVFERSGGVWAEQKTITASDAAVNDYFGTSVAFSSDTVCIGAAGENNNAGAGYIFVFNEGDWVEQQKLTSSDSAADDKFGFSVSVSGETALIGAFAKSSYTGAAYVFVRSGGIWSEQQKLLASDRQSFDMFGASVSLVEETAVIGVYGKNSVTGAAYRFVRNESLWTQQRKFTASDGATGDTFGISVVHDGDTVLIGAQGDNPLGSMSGSVYVYEPARSTANVYVNVFPTADAAGDVFMTNLSAGTVNLDVAANDDLGGPFALAGFTALPEEHGTLVDWDNGIFNYTPNIHFAGDTGFEYTVHAGESKMMSSDGAAGDSFGQAVAIQGDTAVVGAPLNEGLGAAYVVVRNGNVWEEQQKLTASDGAADDRFGCSAAIYGDTVVVGAFGRDDMGLMSGAAYVFTRTDGAWSEQAKLTAANGSIADSFGVSISIYGDTVLIGASGENVFTGAAYVFVRRGAAWIQQAKLTASDGTGNDAFGTQVSLYGDTALIGVPSNAIGRTGAAYIFVREGQQWMESQKLTASDGTVNNGFGGAVALEGGMALIGAPKQDSETGAAYVFSCEEDVWSEAQKIPALSGMEGSTFGDAVALSGMDALIGASRDSSLASYAGSVCLFSCIDGIWTHQRKWTASDMYENQGFGCAAAMSGTLVLAGALDRSKTTVGAAYFSGRDQTVSVAITVLDDILPEVTVDPLITVDVAPVVSGTVADNVAVASVNVRVDGVFYPAEVTGTAWTAIVTGPLAPGVYDVQAEAIDTAGNRIVDSTTGELIIAIPCVADFSANPLEGSAPLLVQFTNISTGDCDASVWDFGDGGSSFEWSPAHEYSEAGLYTVQLTISGNGGSDIEVKAGYITVIDPGEGEGGGEGWIEGEGEEGEGLTEGEDEFLTADQDANNLISLSELLRVIQFFNSNGLHCQEGTEDGYAPGSGDQSCVPYDSDYNPQDWFISLSELLRVIQFFNSGGYHYCPEEGTEDTFCPGIQSITNSVFLRRLNT